MQPNLFLFEKMRSDCSLIADIALLTERRYTSVVAEPGDWYLQNILQDDQLLTQALGNLGLSAVRVDWSQPDIDWSRFRSLVFRSTWDYFDRFTEFKAWLQALPGDPLILNPLPIIHWNLDKLYLADLREQGIPIVPTRYLETGTALNLVSLLQETGWNEAVIKPCVSGAARHTFRVNAVNAHTVEKMLQPLLQQEAFLLQPFQHKILEEGEYTLMVFAGQVTHAVRKVPKTGDFRVQDDHGGKVCDHLPSAAQVKLAQRAFAACQHILTRKNIAQTAGRNTAQPAGKDTAPVYGRVDMVCDAAGHFAIMELELIEPELWLRHHPSAAVSFAQAISQRLHERDCL